MYKEKKKPKTRTAESRVEFLGREQCSKPRPHQLGSLGECCKLPPRGLGQSPGKFDFGATWDAKIHYRNALMRNFQGYFSRNFQDLKLQFPGLSRTKVIFQDFPGPGI